MAAQLSFPQLSTSYRERRPEKTVLHQAVARHFRTFEAMAEAQGKRLPRHVKEEFESFLRCGVLAHGFLRLKCSDCKHEKLLAFSCKKRGFCSSCGGRRMAETAAHLVDEIIPKVGVRQYVLSFPMPVRFILAKNPKIQAHVLKIVHRAIGSFIQKKAKDKGFKSKLKPGAVTLIQRFGGSLNLNVHYHMIFLEGGYYESPHGPRFWWIDPPTDEEIQKLVKTLAHRVIRFLKKKGYFQDDHEQAVPEEETIQEDLLPELQAASVRSRVAMGERRGQRVRRLGALMPGDFQSELKGPLCAATQGFSLHAATYCAPYQRGKLEKLCRYIARPAVSDERLQMQHNGDIVLKLKTQYSDGTSHLLFSGLEFIEKLAALIPQPRIHLTRYFGVLAPHSKLRSEVVPKKVDPTDTTQCGAEKPKKKKRIPWAQLLARVFAIDMKHCPHCPGELRPIAAIVKSSAIRSILTHLGIPDKPPDISPPRLREQMVF
jgi:ribosomal protein S27E